MPNLKTVVVGGVTTACVSRSELIGLMIEDAAKARNGSACKLVFDINGQGIAMTKSSPAFRADLHKADIVHADGQPIVLASRLLTRTPIPERTCTTDVFQDAAAAAATAGLRFYLLGGTEAVNAACADAIRARFPGLVVAGRHHGYFSSAEEEDICADINAAGADVVWVGLGKPREQAFCARNGHRLKAGWAITCGGCFNYIVGDYGRAPAWMQRSGLEWLYRLSEDPKKFFWRYISTNPIALYVLLMQTRSGVLDAGPRA